MSLALLSSIITTACTEAAFGVANIPVKLSDIEIKKNIKYGDDRLQNLDIYLPPKLTSKKLPVVVFIHGGRWTFGNKKQYAFIGNSLAQNGYITVLINHRKYPEVKFPTFVEDGAQAVAWVYNNIEKHGGDKNHLFISGHSSGAHIGSLISVDPRYLKKHNLTPDIISGFAGLAGPYDFIPEAEDLKDMFGPPSKYPQMQVSTFISKDHPPFLMQWGKADTTVIYRNIQMVEDAAKDKSSKNINIIGYTDMDHVDLIKNFAWVNMGDKIVMKDMIQFFQEIQKKGK
jgi:acetyl esterase/lipase